MKTSFTSILFTLPFLAAAWPAPANPGQSCVNEPASPSLTNDIVGTITAEDIIKVAPVTASCDGRGNECITAHQAAPALAKSFQKWGITSFGSQAAVVSTILYESGNFEYDTPISPVVGKGTRNMQSGVYNGKYAAALGLSTSSGPATDQTVALLNQDIDNSFGSGAWFLAQPENCAMDIRDQMHNQEAAGYQKYVAKCLVTTEFGDRQKIWDALLALKKW